MFPGAQQLHDHSTVQSTNGGSTPKIVKIQRVLSVLELLGGVTIALFLGGVVAPSFLRSGIREARLGWGFSPRFDHRWSYVRVHPPEPWFCPTDRPVHGISRCLWQDR